MGDLVLVKVPGRSSKLGGSFYPNPYVVTELRGTQVCVRRGDGKVFRRNTSCVKRFARCDVDDYVTPTTVDVGPPAALDVCPAAPQDDPTVQRTRSGRVVRKPQRYGDPVEY